MKRLGMISISVFALLSVGHAEYQAEALTGSWTNMAGREIILQAGGEFQSTDIHFGGETGEWQTSVRDERTYLLLKYTGTTFEASYFGELAEDDGQLVYRILLYTETEAWCNGKIDWELYGEWDRMDYYYAD